METTLTKNDLKNLSDLTIEEKEKLNKNFEKELIKEERKLVKIIKKICK